MGVMIMTTQTALVLAGIVSAFLTFGIGLAWADFYTQGRQRPASENAPAAEDDRQDLPAVRRAA